MEKIPIKDFPFAATPIVLVATEESGKINVAPHGQYGTVIAKPPTLFISVMKEHLTAQNIQKTKIFSVNIPNKMILEKLLQCGISGTEKDKSTIFKTFYRTLNVPMIEECSVNYECEVVQTIEIAYCFMFLGAIKGTYIDNNCLEESQPNIAKIDPLFASADSKFWTIQALPT